MKRYVVFAMFFFWPRCNHLGGRMGDFQLSRASPCYGKPFTGTGYFKFAIIDREEDTSLWSNDLTSEYGDEPASSVMIAVTRGVFQVMIGSPELAWSLCIARSFNSTSDL